MLKYSLKFYNEVSVVGTMKGMVGTKPGETCPMIMRYIFVGQVSHGLCVHDLVDLYI